MSSIDRYVRMINQYEGRDKLTKVIVYGGRFLNSAVILKKYQEKLIKLKGLSEACADTRRFCRLFKSLSEINYIVKLIKLQSNESNKIDEFNRLFSILIRSFYAMYYLFDNIYILQKCKFIGDKGNSKDSFQKAMNFWFIGLVLRLVLQLRSLLRIHYSEIKVRQKLPYLKNEQENIEAQEELQKIKKQKVENFLWLLRTCGDMLVSFKGSELAIKLLKIQVNDTVTWFGGLLSAILACYQLY
ncbi:peroxisomal biogenesis factor 11 (macronuclear) [Tetrahymena thermophila SB210]|uniref:Peroxisomal biogenesis factor 11 n=1 Tax=Tetrahymena thermophila (strain SB210) TaxID=312017 RepID=Q23CZ1_TETTS|nr:peroxisomal biogenesis factor 11 [Tetrahymena thermophila SB210]EAR94395.2 peroxisomal biogenesis factor 11 [Tetrahymena thermophila SB210]|eukprot:XP_001014895.2 peroxisomal biogenesis factor 11 [Tetrahymena thermophila SB210]